MLLKSRPLTFPGNRLPMAPSDIGTNNCDAGKLDDLIRRYRDRQVVLKVLAEADGSWRYRQGFGAKTVLRRSAGQPEMMATNSWHSLLAGSQSPGMVEKSDSKARTRPRQRTLLDTRPV